MIFSLCRAGIAAAVLGVVGLATASAAAPEPVDLGPLAEHAGDQTVSVTIALKLDDPAGAEAMMQKVSTPGNPLYQKFITPERFAAQFGPSEATVTKIITQLRGGGLDVERTTTTTLKATGTPAAIERVFQTTLHQFQLPGTDNTPASNFRAPIREPVVPAEIAPAVHAVLGLSTRPVFHPHLRAAPASLGNKPVEMKVTPNSASTLSPPGYLTVTDFAALYNVTPLYTRGITGTGRTLAIVTLASFTRDDAFLYWNALLGLNVDPNRLTVVNVDGGPGAPSDASSSSETTLDVEQAGGVAPGANIIVYQAPNTNQGFLDAFAAAIQSNQAESLSTSWGMWEFFAGDFDSVTDPFSGQFVSFMQATHELFVEAALQGQSVFAASGDFGAFDSFQFFPPPSFTFPLTVDFPAADSAITAGGSTTLPSTQQLSVGGTPITINVPTERVWGWDYLQPVCDALGLDKISCGIFPIGSGGGVSVFSRVPFYQLRTPGVQTSQPGQALIENTTPPQALFVLPAQFAGRNVPDVSFNADPNTGYLILYTSDVNGRGFQRFKGGGSFVAPQLNGVAALLAQNAGHRVGFLNPLLYGLPPVGGAHAVLNTISAGDNWFYSGRHGYSPAAGLGTLNVSNLAKLIK
jgi:kumamolisin